MCKAIQLAHVFHGMYKCLETAISSIRVGTESHHFTLVNLHNSEVD